MSDSYAIEARIREERQRNSALVLLTSRLTIQKVVQALRTSPRKSDQTAAEHISANLKPLTYDEVMERT